MENEEQRLLAHILDALTEKFGKHAILRGGMVLKILGSPRYTNDIDYLFVPYHSKKETYEELLTCLQQIKDTTCTASLNSQCLRIHVTQGTTKVQIEAKIAPEMKTSVVSTKLYSPQFNLPKRLVHIVDHSISLANKLATWNERRLIRDVYDIWFFLQMDVQPDLPTLEQRIKKPTYSRLIKETDHFKGTALNQFFDFFRKKTSMLTEQEIKNQLLDYMTEEECSGLLPLFQAAFIKLKNLKDQYQE